ncbi:MAG TPA: class I SAM-dependent methyltransferase [Pirellulales bacterium]|jgi:cyclopropane-fatty-acyl-phospholipid synthase|nr:class I SAM-dependent methyltransferase [Pirellulales bacterium]
MQRSSISRNLALIGDAVVYGPSYGVLNYLVRSPVPLDAERTWRLVTRKVAGPVDWVAKNYPPPAVRRWLLRHKLRQDARLGIAAHYDVSNEFYELFLDREFMFYSCADFVLGNETLEEAQRKKADFLLRLIDPRPGEKILELGCGWGSMLKRIYQATGDKQNLHGYTLSEKQVEYNAAHHQFQVEFKNFVTAEYPEAYFDKIYSIGAWEHVRPHEVPLLLAKLHRALKPAGRLVQHFFCRLCDPLPASAVISQIFFPGAVNSSLRFHRQAFEAAGFRITHLSVHDYRDTLRAWFDRLAANRQRAIELVGVATYNRWLVFFPAAWKYFDDVTGQLFRFVLEKAGERGAI